mmetsp:Transcript_24976/g.80475  ORF Transcript_24976/g.80475 Transcript_24976/m.80475 type:complete len:212 (+) Transcript_24976:431-1066(+)
MGRRPPCRGPVCKAARAFVCMVQPAQPQRPGVCERVRLCVRVERVCDCALSRNHVRPVGPRGCSQWNETHGGGHLLRGPSRGADTTIRRQPEPSEVAVVLAGCHRLSGGQHCHIPRKRPSRGCGQRDQLGCITNLDRDHCVVTAVADEQAGGEGGSWRQHSQSSGVALSPRLCPHPARHAVQLGKCARCRVKAEQDDLVAELSHACEQGGV